MALLYYIYDLKNTLIMFFLKSLTNLIFYSINYSSTEIITISIVL